MDFFPGRKTGKCVTNEGNVGAKKGKQNAKMVGVPPGPMDFLGMTGKGVE